MFWRGWHVEVPEKFALTNPCRSGVPTLRRRIEKRNRRREKPMSMENKETTDPYDIFQPSDCVRHPKFGEGLILSRSGSGEDTKLVVSFAEEGEKRLLAAKANLKRVRPGTGEIKELKDHKVSRSLKSIVASKALEETEETPEEEFSPALDYGTDAEEDEGESGFDLDEAEDEEEQDHEDERDDY